VGAKIRVVRRRIRSVQSTMKITRAMELIAASRIVKAQARVEAARPYAELLTRAMEDVARQTGSLVHPLLDARPDARRAGVFVITSDRGLAGAYSSNVLRLTERTIGRLRDQTGDPVALYVAGKKGLSYFRFRGAPIEASWTGFSEVPPYSAAEEIGRRLIDDFGNGTIDELHAVYTDFRTAFTFRAAVQRFLPIAAEEIVSAELGKPHPEYIFEPSPAAILDEMLPQYVITKVYFAMLESAASENAARQRAMAAATDNGEELMKVLTREANQARQAEITTEIMEIVGGAEALAAARSEE
jgi:F-type H+-transporting ATPase subunit gamma